MAKEKLGEVQDVGDVKRSLFYGEDRDLGLFSLFLSFILFALTISYRHINAIFFSMLPLFIYVIYISNKAHRIFMKRFAEENGFGYEKTASKDTLQGRLFEIGHSSYVSNVISTEYDNHPIRIFNYRFTVGYGRNSTNYNFTVLEISFEKVEFPHILLQSRRWGGHVKPKKRDDVKISLENEFNKHFDLFVAKGYEIEALQIFTPDTLRLINEKASSFGIEFAGKTLCVFDRKTISKKKDLKELHDVTKEVFGSIGPLLNRLENDFEALHHYYKK